MERSQRLPAALLMMQISIMITENLTNAGLALDPSENHGEKWFSFGLLEVPKPLMFAAVCGMLLKGEVMSMRPYLVQHGEARSEEEDPERSLTVRGEEEV